MHDVFCFTDLHGQLNLFHTMRDWCYAQDPECTIVFLGDAADRGEHGYQIIKEILDDPQIIYIYGNHEDLFVKAADQLIGQYAANDETYQKLHNVKTEEEAKQIIVDARGWDIGLHLRNGGYPTLRDWLLDGADEEVIDRLRILPRTFTYENVDFCHAGGTYKAFDVINQQEYNDEARDYYAEQKCIWDRDNLALGWETGRICVHGHTPTILLPRSLYGSADQSEAHAHPAAWTDHMGAKDKRGGYKIDMDTGMTWTGRGYVLNALTMIIYGFFDVKVPTNGEIDEPIKEVFENYKII